MAALFSCLWITALHIQIYSSAMFNTLLVFLPPNTTSKLQPNNVGIIQAIKIHNRKLLLQYVLLYSNEASGMFHSSKKCDIVDAILWLTNAWDNVKPITIHFTLLNVVSLWLFLLILPLTVVLLLSWKPVKCYGNSMQILIGTLLQTGKLFKNGKQEKARAGTLAEDKADSNEDKTGRRRTMNGHCQPRPIYWNSY